MNISACLVRSGRCEYDFFLFEPDDERLFSTPAPGPASLSVSSMAELASTAASSSRFRSPGLLSLSRTSSSSSMLSVGLVLTKNCGSDGSNSLLCCGADSSSSTRLPAGLIFGELTLSTSPSWPE
ncbi:hypothetical protein OGATHE_004000 [Ogataea polymorpha]|uniref:Uncharacterized protein n=1 Tax=Ogataea polymorpha TaxID=460523 RepID=A0A9P8P532_9ASCO|nr:hypothetical protein OGATHE_004000 [Ogataea polymorpha]